MIMDNPVQILCVDDERNVLRALQRVFLDEDYTLHTALSGSEGLEILSGNPEIQVVISDYRMPEMDGVEFLREVCSRYPDTVRIVLSGYADTAAVVDAINEGQIYRFIPKPWNDDELRVTIANALESYFLKEHNRQLMEKLQDSNEELQVMNENLEKMVTARTEELLFRNKVLASAQNVLHALPIAVIGFDSEDMVACCNESAESLLGLPEGEMVGSLRSEVLPAALNLFIDQLEQTVCRSELMTVKGHSVRVKGVRMPYRDQEGIILALDRSLADV